jgi:hypothetical protein
MLLKPRRERKSVGRTLAGEASLNLQMIALQLAARERYPNSIPADFRLSTLAFQALASQIGSLPSDARQSVILLYNRVDYLNRSVDLYGQFLDKLRSTPADDPHRLTYERQVDAAIEAFYRILDTTFDSANRTIELLHKRVESRFFAEKRELGKFDSVRERVEIGLDDLCIAVFPLAGDELCAVIGREIDRGFGFTRRRVLRERYRRKKR